MQVLVTAAGGKIRKNPNGIEAIVAKDISINDHGINHPMYKGKKKIFDSFCWHYDDTEFLPQNTSVLASNLKSKIQSISFINNEYLLIHEEGFLIGRDESYTNFSDINLETKSTDNEQAVQLLKAIKQKYNNRLNRNKIIINEN